MATSLVLWRTLGWWETQAFQAELDGRADGRVKLLAASLLRSTDVLHSVGSLMAARGGDRGEGNGGGTGVTRAEFRRFVAGALSRQPELLALGWTPRVPAADRAAYEAAARADGLAGFEFQQIGPAGKPVRAAEQAEYLPVFYLEPSDRNALAMGFELDSDPTRAAALRLTADTGEPVATPPVRLVQDLRGGRAGEGATRLVDPSPAGHSIATPSPADSNGGRADTERANAGRADVAETGFIVYLAVPPSAAPAGTPPLGYASAVYRVRDLAERVAATSPDEGLAFDLSDGTGVGTGRDAGLTSGAILYRRPAADTASAPGFDPAGSDGSADGAAAAGRASLPVAGRTWTVTVRPGPGFAAAHRHRESWLVLVGGLAMTGVLTAYLSAGLRRRAVIELKVEERTAQLRAEVADRRRAEAAAKAAEAAARVAEAKYRGIFDHAVEGVFQTTPDGRYLDANPALARIYGYPTIAELAADLTNIGGQLYVDPARRAEFIRRAQQDGAVTDFESQVYRKDGRVIWIAENARAVRDDDGRVLFYEGTVVDVTERRRAADLLKSDRDALESRVRDRTAELDRAVRLLKSEVGERRRAQEQAAAASAAKSRFLANVSHEIRTPMNAILGYAQLLGGAANLTPDQRDALATVLSSGRHLLDLIDDVLDLSKVEAGRAELAVSTFSPAGLVTEVATMFDPRCREKGIGLTVDLSPDLPAWSAGDERKLRQVLLNLVANAVKFTDAGRVTIRVTEAEVGFAVVAGAADDAEPTAATAYRFEVADTGVGIPPEAAEAIFEPFQQGVAGASRGGTGLGLAIARGHLELMGARLKVDSVPGRGSRFHFELRLDTADAPWAVNAAWPDVVAGATRPGTAPQHPRLAVARPPRVLVVDDAPDSRRVVADLVRAVGCDAEVAGGADEALAMVAASRFDLLLVDAVMPGTSGLAAAPRLAARAGDGVKLIAMSASAMLHERGQYAEAGFADFLPKPVELGRLARTVANVLGVALTYKRAAAAYPGVASGPVTGGDRPRPGAIELLPADLRARVLRAARRCSVTDLRRCLEELERDGPGGPTAELIRRGLRAYDMESITAALSDAAHGTDANDGQQVVPGSQSPQLEAMTFASMRTDAGGVRLAPR
jgi:PAS domain S-box-containing protein